MRVTLADGSFIDCADEPFAEGGEGRLFWDRAGTHVIKLYKNNDPDREAALEKIIGSDYSVVLGEPYWDEFFSWPKAIIRQPTLGLTMLRAPKGTMELRWFLGAKPRRVVAAQHGPEKLGRWINYLSVAIKMARVVRRMHYRGLCHSDLSFRNFLIDPQANRVVLIDCDGLVVPGFLPPNVLGTPMCMAPELTANQTSSRSRTMPSAGTDLHALATLIYWLLFQRHPLLGPKVHSPDPAEDEALALGEKALFIEHPADFSNRPNGLPIPYTTMLTPEVQELVRRAFVDGLHDASLRPQAADWERFLIRMGDSVIPCSNPKCPMGVFVFQPHRPARCPVCNTSLHTFTQLPLLNFYRPRGGRQGEYSSDRGYTLVGWPGRPLYLWHAYADKNPGPGVDERPQARLDFDPRESAWYLQNLELPDVRLLDSHEGVREVGPGQRARLNDGARLLLGAAEQSRLAYVQLVKLE